MSRHSRCCSLIAIWASFVFCCMMCTPRCVAEVFYSKLDQVNFDIIQLLGQTQNDLTQRIVLHPQQNRVQVPLHGRKRLVALTKDEDSKIGAEIAQQLERMEAFYESEPDIERIQTIANRIVKVLPEPIPLKVYLADTDSVNAFCLIGGTLIVTRGALNFFKDEELAFIIGHEYGHAVSRHSAESATKAIAAEEIGEKVVSRMAEKAHTEGNTLKAIFIQYGYSFIAKLGVLMPYSRTMENEADALGIVYMVKAGYEASGALSAMKRMQEISDNEIGWKEFLSTHPATSKRYERLETYTKCEDFSILEDAASEDSEAALDWTYDAIKMLEAITFEEQKCENAIGEVLFVPGIFMDKAENYLPKLAEAYPKYNLSVLQWKAVSKLSWERSVYRADMLSNYLSRFLKAQNAEELRSLVLVGHSLGGRVIINASNNLKQANLKVRKIVLMGSAISFDAKELTNCENVSIDAPVSIFNPSDRVLKYAFFTQEKIPALGLMGSREKLPRFLEYHYISHSGEEETTADKGRSHSAFGYLECLAKVEHGDLAYEDVKIDHSSIVAPQKISIPIPSTGGRVIETYNYWDLIGYVKPIIFSKKKPKEESGGDTDKYFYFVIRNPYGEYCGSGKQYSKIREEFDEIKKKLNFH